MLGEVLDPIADKILIVFVFLGLSVNLESNFVGFLTSIIISREIWVAALRDLSSRYNNSNATKVTFLAKIKTTVQMITALIYITGLLINNFLMILIGDIFLVIATLITVYTGFQYTFKTFNKKISLKHIIFLIIFCTLKLNAGPWLALHDKEITSYIEKELKLHCNIDLYINSSFPTPLSDIYLVLEEDVNNSMQCISKKKQIEGMLDKQFNSSKSNIGFQSGTDKFYLQDLGERYYRKASFFMTPQLI